jgi:hypothetical protein
MIEDVRPQTLSRRKLRLNDQLILINAPSCTP